MPYKHCPNHTTMVRIKIKTKVSPSTTCPLNILSASTIRKFLLMAVFFVASVSYSLAQVSDTLAFADSKSSRLKYLKSLALEDQEKCEKATFLENFGIDLTNCKEAKTLANSEFKKGPSDGAESCKEVIPSGSIVKLYNFYPDENYWAVKYGNKWGFLPDMLVKRLD